MNSIPLDLIHEIFSRLPSKSIWRCCCVSKLWMSLLCRPDFTELFLTRSLARPLLLFIKRHHNGEWLFFSSPQPHSPCEKSSLAVDFQFKLPGEMQLDFCGRASYLFCFRSTTISSTNKYEETVHVICNPSIGKYGFLPKLRTSRYSKSILVFDPTDKIFKVLSMGADGHQILSLGRGIMSWRKIQCPLTYDPSNYNYFRAICINGILYYFARESDGQTYVIVCFDVRSEKLIKPIHVGFIDGLHCTTLVNYKGKLGVISNKELGVWAIIEDIEKQEWSKCDYTFPDNRLNRHVLLAGVTATGEIILSDGWREQPFHLYYFNPKINTLQSVKIQDNDQMFGVGYHIFVDYTEDLTFNMKAHQHQDRSRFESTNKFDALDLLDDA